MSKVLAGEFPQRPSDGIPGPIWEFLEKCWSMDPTKRPSIVQVHDALSRFQPLPPPMEELPRADNPQTVPTPGWLEEPIVGVAGRRTDKIVEVIQLVLSPSSSNRTSIIGTCASEPNAAVGKDQTSGAAYLWRT